MPSMFIIALLHLILCWTEPLLCVSHIFSLFLLHRGNFWLICWSFRFYACWYSIDRFLWSVSFIFYWGTNVLSLLGKWLYCFRSRFRYRNLLRTYLLFAFVIHLNLALRAWTLKYHQANEGIQELFIKNFVINFLILSVKQSTVYF